MKGYISLGFVVFVIVVDYFFFGDYVEKSFDIVLFMEGFVMIMMGCLK